MADQDDEIEDDASDAPDVAASDAMAPAMTSSMKMPAPGTAPPDWKQYLQDKQDQLAAAQKQSATNQMYTGLARAGATLSAGLAHSNAPVNQQPFDAMAATDQQPVTDVQNAQKSETQGLANQSAAMDATKKFNSTDPNSAESIAVRAQIKKLYGDKVDSATLDTMSASEIGDSILKPLELNQKITEHKDEMASRSADRQALFSSKKQDKQDADHEKYVQHAEDNEKNWRSDPASSRYDNMISASTTGKALIDRYRGHEDDMPIQDIHALVSDKLKAITGAAPTEQEIKAAIPDTLKTRWGGVKSFFTGSPEPAGAGDFVRDIDQDFRTMEGKAQDGLRHRQETIASSPRLTKEDHDRLVKIAVPERAYTDQQAAAGPAAPADDHASRAAAILQKRNAAKSAEQGYAFGGTVQPPGFAHVRQPMAPHVPMPKPMAMPKAPTAQIPVGMTPVERPMHFEKGGTVPGQPMVNHNDPRNDVQQALLTPKEEVLPLSVTQSKSPSTAAYLHMKSRGYK